MYKFECDITGCGVVIEHEDYDFVAAQAKDHYLGSHGLELDVEAFLGKAPKVKKEKVSKAETLDTYPMKMESSSDPVVEEPKPVKKVTRKPRKSSKKKK